MGIKQPTVSFHLKRLEEEAGVPLFQTRQKRIFLTDAGRALLHYAERIVSWTEEAENALQDYYHHKRGHIIIGSSNTPSAHFLPETLRLLQTRYPQMKMTVRVKNAPLILQMVKRFEVDTGIVVARSFEDPEVIVEPLFPDDLGLVVPPDHPLASVSTLSPHHIEAIPLVLREAGSTSRQLTEQWAHQHHIALRIALEMETTEAIKKSVIAGLGASILSRLAVKQECAEGKLVFHAIPTPVFQRQVMLIYHRQRFMTPLMKDVIQYLMEKKRALPAVGNARRQTNDSENFFTKGGAD